MKRNTMVWAGAVLAVSATLGFGCGSDDGRFDASVAEVRTAVDDGDRTAAMQALEDLALEALAARENGDIDDEELSEVARLIESSQALVGQLTPRAPSASVAPPSTEATTTTSPPAPAPAQQDADNDEDDGKDDGKDDGEGKGDKGRGKGKGNGDD